MKKPFYKRWWFIALAVFIVLGAIGALLEDEETTSEDKVETVAPVVEEDPEDALQEEVAESTIDTSVFEYATNIEVTDAIDINKHVTVKLTISQDSEPGMQVQNIITQTFDFLQQEDIKEAKTITIFVVQGDIKVTQYTVNKEKFMPNETDSMVDLVLQASEIEQMSDEVKQHGEALELW